MITFLKPICFEGEQKQKEVFDNVSVFGFFHLESISKIQIINVEIQFFFRLNRNLISQIDIFKRTFLFWEV